MIWADWGAFLAMGGYAPYVWGAYGVTAAGIALEIVALVRRRRAILEELRAEARRRAG